MDNDPVQPGYRFPFGQPVLSLTQQDRSPKSVFVLGVYASAVHARWIGDDNKTKVVALAVASEPEIFWDGNACEASDIIAKISIPDRAGRLESAQKDMNGPSGRSLRRCFFEPMGITRNDAWLCDIVPHSCRNSKQAQAIEREYAPLMKEYGLPETSLPPVPNPLCGNERRAEILAELQESKAETVVLLGDEPIEWFLRGRWTSLRQFGTTNATYGRKHRLPIGGREYDVLPLVHPRQASKLGVHSAEWNALHQGWVDRGGEPA